MPAPEKGGTSYRAVLALPHALRLFTVGILARLCYGLLGILLLLALRHGTGSYAAAGTAVGLYGLLTALLGPARARLVERHSAALMLLAGGYALSLLALAAACAAGIAALPACGLAVLAGLFPPPVGPLMRTQWSKIAGDEAQCQRALSLDTAAESTVFALGPVLAGVLIAVSSAPIVLAGCAALVLAAFTMLTATLRSVGMGARTEPSERGRRHGPLRAKGFSPLLVIVWVIAVALSASEIAVVAAWGPVTGGILTALIPVGGVLGGLFYGQREWHGALARRPLILAACSAICYAIPALAYVPPAAGAALLLAGMCADTLLISTYQLVNVLVSGGARTEAGAWLNTAYNLGSAIGASVGGVVISRSGPLESFGAVAGLIALCTVICAPLTLRRGVAATASASAEPQPATDSSHPA